MQPSRDDGRRRVRSSNFTGRRRLASPPAIDVVLRDEGLRLHRARRRRDRRRHLAPAFQRARGARRRAGSSTAPSGLARRPTRTARAAPGSRARRRSRAAAAPAAAPARSRRTKTALGATGEAADATDGRRVRHEVPRHEDRRRRHHRRQRCEAGLAAVERLAPRCAPAEALACRRGRTEPAARWTRGREQRVRRRQIGRLVERSAAAGSRARAPAPRGAGPSTTSLAKARLPAASRCVVSQVPASVRRLKRARLDRSEPLAQRAARRIEIDRPARASPRRRASTASTHGPSVEVSCRRARSR